MGERVAAYCVRMAAGERSCGGGGGCLCEPSWAGALRSWARSGRPFTGQPGALELPLPAPNQLGVKQQQNNNKACPPRTSSVTSQACPPDTARPAAAPAIFTPSRPSTALGSGQAVPRGEAGTGLRPSV